VAPGWTNWERRFVGDAAEEKSSATFFPDSRAVYRVGAAPGGSIPSPAITVISDEQDDDRRQLRLRVTAGARGSELNCS